MANVKSSASFIAHAISLKMSIDKRASGRPMLIFDLTLWHSDLPYEKVCASCG